jgi:hypothetical protein
MHYPSPQWLKVDGLHPHLAQQMADARNFTKSKVMVFHPKEGESCSVPAKDRNAWTLAASPLTRSASIST